MTKQEITTFRRKKWMTPSVTAPGDINLSEATVFDFQHMMSGDGNRDQMMMMMSV